MLEVSMFTLIVPVTLKDDVVDCLMSLPKISGFNLTKMSGYSKEHSLYDISEQVEGYRAFYQFDILITSNEINALKHHLKPICQGAKLRYWVTPVTDNGHF
ncbi:hypothetical protein NBRC116592_07320 [Colwellia sp. KU-HH00111]|uniref:DUF3240 family protein n=1 Tax=Colwellia sp. KU-HH00111 TaxID=3127652 RepID=UPI00310A63BB